MISETKPMPILAWIPGTDDVKLVKPGEHVTPGYYTGLGCYTHIEAMNFEDRKKMIFIEAMHLIIRDKCNPDAVHKALLGLEEYRDGCSNDMPGINS